MKFNEQWLRDWVNPEINTQGLVEQITMAGLEVDGVEPVAGRFEGVVIGEVRRVEPHPNADKLRVCEVFDGRSTEQVVCGAPNVREGLKVAFARVGAVLPGDFKIKRAKLRGTESAGMLCSEKELGLSEDHEGIMELPDASPVGEYLFDVLGLDDVTVEVDLTPNRADCLSIRGLAREVGVLNKLPVEEPQIDAIEATHSEIVSIDVEAPDACPRYIGRVIRNVDVNAVAPQWMTERLRRCGLRSIDPVVDVTNYVMLELGQPMHAFDLELVKSGIVVRMARKGEKLTLLDGQEVELTPDTLVIADQQKPVAMAGIMGGEDSGVSKKTRDILLESAFFNPRAIAGRARRYGLHTDSSHRFERGVDYKLQRQATERATSLLLEICGGEPGEIVEVASQPDLPEDRIVELREERISQVLGIEINRTEVEEILTRLGLHVDKLTKHGWEVHVPSYRPDIAIEVDLLEEIGRIFGYNNLPVTEPQGDLGLRSVHEDKRPVSRVRDHLVSLDYQEAITYSFVDSKSQRQVDPEHEGIGLANPISSDMDVMRTSLWPGLLQTVEYNQKRQQDRIRLFETGLRFIKEGEEIRQEPMLAGVVTGSRRPENWLGGAESVDFYEVKGDLESLFQLLGITVDFVAGRHPGLHPGQCARLEKDGETVGWLGAVHPQLQKNLDLNGAIYMFELCLNPILKGYVPNFKEFSKYPEVRRDLAIIVDNEVSWAEIEKTVQLEAGDYLTGLRVFDVYQGENIGKGRKSLALSLFWQHPERTLNDEEIQAVFDQVVARLRDALGATLRS
ncbi:phenylalanine--tRNA ligase subunit beta [Marinobacteraceae bacterium S3BR75-40.1]